MENESYYKLLYIYLKYGGTLHESYPELMQVQNLKDRFTRKFLECSYKPNVPPFDDSIFDSFLYAVCATTSEEDAAKELFLLGRFVIDNGMLLQINAPLTRVKWRQLQRKSKDYSRSCMRQHVSFIEYLYTQEIWYFALTKQYDCYKELANMLTLPDMIRCNYVLYTYCKYKYFPFYSTLFDLSVTSYFTETVEYLRDFYGNPECSVPFESYTYGLARLISSSKFDRYIPPKLWSELKFCKAYHIATTNAEEFAISSGLES